MWAHCCNKGASVARCPGALLETPSKCGRQSALSGHCESDATLLCAPYFDSRNSKSGGSKSRALVYSFGIAGEWAFEEWAGLRGYEVHAFDPTIKTREQHEQHRARNVHFHYLGLGAKGGVAGALRTRGYGALGGDVLALDEDVHRKSDAAPT